MRSKFNFRITVNNDNTATNSGSIHSIATTASLDELVGRTYEDIAIGDALYIKVSRGGVASVGYVNSENCIIVQKVVTNGKIAFGNRPGSQELIELIQEYYMSPKGNTIDRYEGIDNDLILVIGGDDETARKFLADRKITCSEFQDPYDLIDELEIIIPKFAIA